MELKKHLQWNHESSTHEFKHQLRFRKFAYLADHNSKKDKSGAKV